MPVLDLDVLLGRHGEEDDPPGQLGEDARFEQAEAGAEHAADLGVVAAGVDRARDRIGLRVVRHAERVELAEDRDGRAVPAAAGGRRGRR